MGADQADIWVAKIEAPFRGWEAIAIVHGNRVIRKDELGPGLRGVHESPDGLRPDRAMEVLHLLHCDEDSIPITHARHRGKVRKTFRRSKLLHTHVVQELLEGGGVRIGVGEVSEVLDGIAPLRVHATEKKLFDLGRLPRSKACGVEIRLFKAAIGSPSMHRLFRDRYADRVPELFRSKIKIEKFLLASGW